MFKDRYILGLRERGEGCQAGGKEEAAEDAEDALVWERGAPCHSHPALSGAGEEPAGSAGCAAKAELPPEPGLRSLRCRSFTVTARSGGKKKGGHQEIPTLPPSFKTSKRPEQWQER